MSAAALAAAAPAAPTRTLFLRLAAFFALATFCLAHYSVLVAGTSAARIVALVAAATAGGAALVMSGELKGARGLVARIGVAVVICVAALVITGVRARLLLPTHWGELRDGIDRGFAGLNSFVWPYDGGDPWVRLTLLLGMPLLLAPATIIAFWPARRLAGVRRGVALTLLLVAYGTGTTQLGLGAWVLRGSALLAVTAAWLWLPRLRARETVPAATAVVACGLLALPLAAGLEHGTPWVDYKHWNWFQRADAGTTFRWDHSYGPIAWSRTGVALLDVKAREPHYWKAETLDSFDGLRWLHSDVSYSTGTAADEIPQPIDPRWIEHIRFTVRKLRSPVVVGAGTIFRVESGKVTTDESDGTVRVLDRPLEEGDTYAVDAYVPDPSAREMRAAPRRFTPDLLSETAFELPRRGDSARRTISTSESAFSIGERTVAATVPGQALPDFGARRVLASPYARMYQLARRLAVGQPTPYDTVKSIQAYLQKGYQYSERPPLRRYPLPAFLFGDKIGYCQQFSGAMALMLRMNGIPARVAAGFAPGNFDHTAKEYRVRDLDAHSWVEVWFSGIGWVPFDPTPSAAPASSQSDTASAASAALGAPSDHGSSGVKKRLDPAAVGAGGAGEGAGPKWWLLVTALLVLVPLAVLVLWLMTNARRFPRLHARGGEGAVAELRRALDRLGYRYSARTTLAELERRLTVTAGPAAARYVRLLREQRYARPGGAVPPGAADRRALRRALTRGGGPIARLRGLIVLPPHAGFTAD